MGQRRRDQQQGHRGTAWSRHSAVAQRPDLEHDAQLLAQPESGGGARARRGRDSPRQRRIRRRPSRSPQG